MPQNVLPTCPRCRREAASADAAFCAFCGAPIHVQTAETPKGAQEMLDRAAGMKDPMKAYQLLKDAQQQYPDCLAVEEALLYHGRLHERSTRALDFSVIKCFLWQLYLEPQELTAEKREAMREELVNGEQLQRCLTLADDPDLYFRKYLEKLAAQFVGLFLKGSSRYVTSVFGFRLEPRLCKTLAHPMARMMQNVYNDGQLEEKQRDMMYDALYRAFFTEVGDDARWLDEDLKSCGLPVPVKL